MGCAVAAIGTAQCGSPDPGPSAPSPLESPVTVRPRITAIQVGVAANAEARVPPGSKLQLWALESYDDGSIGDATNLAEWQSSDSSVASVAPGGMLTAQSEGTVTVSAIHDRTGTLEVQVRRLSCEELELSPVSQIVTAWPSYCSSCEYFQTVLVTAPNPSCQWSVASDSPWLLLASNPRQKGTVRVDFQLNRNELRAERVGRIVITAGSRRLSHTVTQEGAACRFVVDPPERTLSRGAQSFFSVRPTPEDCSWFAREPAGITLLNSGVKRGPARIEYVVNPDSTFRGAYIDVWESTYKGPPAAHHIEIPAK